ncbi:uncharacterized protein LOC117108451 isoform X2 [Anneissia japonica]|nr:uncharacterized protein LOC117108451 isoform X2 [Anneissia japonica]
MERINVKMDDCVLNQGLTLYHVKFRDSFNHGKEECTKVDLQEKELVLTDHMTGKRLLKLLYKNITSMYSEGESVGFQCGRGSDRQEVVLTTSSSNFMFAYITERKFGNREVKIRRSWGMDTDASDRVVFSELKKHDNPDKAPDDADHRSIKAPDNTTMKKKLEHTKHIFHPLDQNKPPSHYMCMDPSKAPTTSVHTDKKSSENPVKASCPDQDLRFSVLVRENTFLWSSVNGESTLILCSDKLLLDNSYVKTEEWFYKYIKNHTLSGQTIEFTCCEKSPMGAGKIVFDCFENASIIDQILVQYIDTFYVEVSQEDDIARRFSLEGEYKLIVHYDFLELCRLDGTLCHYWRYKKIRSYRQKGSSFFITCGRGSSTGEGNIAFKTEKYKEIFEKVDENVKDIQKNSTKNK